MEILSVDLAHTSYDSLGIVGVEENGDALTILQFLPRDFGLAGPPSPAALADSLATACKRLGVVTLLLDGPQGWKDPENGLEHSRVCERILNTPGKTGLPGSSKPANYLAFIAFSVAVFQALVEHGSRLFSGTVDELLAVESFPLSAWKQLGLVPLPAKSKAKAAALKRAAADLQKVFPVRVPDGLSHDEFQALVAAFAGVALRRNFKAGYCAAGVPPCQREGTWREGFIVNPTRQALTH